MSSAPDIALFIPSLAGGGAESVILQLAGEFSRRGRDVHLVVARLEGPRVGEVPDGVEVIDLHAGRFRYCLPKLIRYLRSERPQAMLSFLTQANAYAIAARWMSRWDGMLATGVRSSLMAGRNNPDWWWQRHTSIVVRLLYRYADVIFAQTEAMTAELLSASPALVGKIFVIPNPIDVDFTRRKGAEDPEFGPLIKTVPAIVGVGRLFDNKGFGTLIEALAIVRSERETHLLIVGEGPEEARLKKLAVELNVAQAVTFTGFLHNPYPVIASADVFCLSSKAEGFPNALLEALALGVPVVSTDCPTGPRELLDNGKFGALVPVDEPRAMAAALLDALDNPPDPSHLVSRAREFGVEKVATMYETYLGLSETLR